MQWARRATKDRPDAAGRAGGVAADHELGLVETLLQRDAADADAADGFDAAVLDEAGNEIERFGEVGFSLVTEIRQREDGIAPAVDTIGEAFEPLARTEISVKAAARIELGGDLGEAGLFRGDDRRRVRRLGRLRRLQRRGARRFFLAASIRRDQEEDRCENTSRRHRTIFGRVAHRACCIGQRM